MHRVNEDKEIFLVTLRPRAYFTFLYIVFFTSRFALSNKTEF